MNHIAKHGECPVCLSKNVFSGDVVDSDGDTYNFQPRGLKWYALVGYLAVEDIFRACIKCGHVWSHLQPTKLRELLEKKGNSSTQEKLK
jgi:hypothetical protein